MRPRTITTKYDRPQWRLMTEFPADTGTTERAVRRIDAVIIENQTAARDYGNYHHVYIHGIEIKVSQRDLLNDHKMTEYTPFVDFFYIAVPEELVPDVEQIRMETWGIIAIHLASDGDGDPIPVARIVTPAAYQPGAKRKESLEFAILQTM